MAETSSFEIVPAELKLGMLLKEHENFLVDLITLLEDINVVDQITTEGPETFTQNLSLGQINAASQHLHNASFLQHYIFERLAVLGELDTFLKTWTLTKVETGLFDPEEDSLYDLLFETKVPPTYSTFKSIVEALIVNKSKNDLLQLHKIFRNLDRIQKRPPWLLKIIEQGEVARYRGLIHSSF